VLLIVLLCYCALALFCSDMNLSSVTTRQKPNCFNHLHHIKRKQCLGMNAGDILEAWENPKFLKEIYGLGPLEASAVKNLLLNMTDEIVSFIAGCVAQFGIVRGPFSHAALGAAAMAIGFRPELLLDDWSDACINSATTVEIMCTRMKQDYHEMHVGARRPISPSEVGNMQKICSSLLFAKTVLCKKIPADHMNAAWDGIFKAFLLKSMDAALLQAAESCPWPFEIDVLPEFKSVMDKAAASMDDEARLKNLELRSQLMTATFESLRAELANDDKLLDKYWATMKERRQTAEVRVMQHTRRRYNLGLKRVNEHMMSRLCLVPDLPEEPRYIGDFAFFKHNLESQLPPGTLLRGSQLVLFLVVCVCVVVLLWFVWFLPTQNDSG
jgi:hypothetical protein